MKKTNVFGILFTCISVFGFAQQQTDSLAVQELNEVVVTDSRFKLKRENSGKTVIKISRSEIENNQGRTLVELINTKSGIEINGSKSVEGQNLGYYIRGGNNRQVLVLIDGIQVNDPSLVLNEFDLRLLDLNTIESVEIIKGGASTLYGNAAATAVISITTRKASKKAISASFLTSIGTNQSQDDQDYDGTSFTNNVTLSGSLNKLNYVASFGNRYVDGLSAANATNAEKDPFSRYNTNLKLGYEINDRISITAFGSYDNFKTDIDGFPPPTYTLADTNDEFKSKQTRVGVAPKFDYTNGSIQVNAAYTDIERETISSFSSMNKAQSFVVDAFNKYTFNNEFYTIVGLNYGDYKSEFSDEESYNTVDPYLNVVYVSDFGLNINAGARFNNHSEYGSHLVYSLNPSYKIDVKSGYAKVFGSYATSFIAPNLSQLFGPFGANPDLEPEENRTIEGGLEYSNGKGFRLNGVFFNRNEENTIIYTTGYENATTDAKVRGVEVEAEAKLIDKLSINANYTFTELKEGVRLRLPKHKANAGVTYNFNERTVATLNYQYNGTRVDTDFSVFQNVDLDSYSLLDVYVSHRILKNKLKLFANITNIFNEDYEEIIGYTTRGRNVLIGMNLTL